MDSLINMVAVITAPKEVVGNWLEARLPELHLQFLKEMAEAGIKVNIL